MSNAKLSPEDIQKHLQTLPDWELRGTKLYRKFSFPDFTAAFSFMTGAALIAEKLDHHPEWSNVYNQVQVELMTHDAKGITEKDFQLASAMEHIANRSLLRNS